MFGVIHDYQKDLHLFSGVYATLIKAISIGKDQHFFCWKSYLKQDSIRNDWKSGWKLGCFTKKRQIICVLQKHIGTIALIFFFLKKKTTTNKQKKRRMLWPFGERPLSLQTAFTSHCDSYIVSDLKWPQIDVVIKIKADVFHFPECSRLR